MPEVDQLVVPIRNGSTITQTVLDIADRTVRSVIPESASSSNKLVTEEDIPQGGGHTIQNPSGTDMTARPVLQFQGLSVTDDSTNEKTIVSLSVSGTATQGAFLTSDGQGGYAWLELSQAEGNEF